MTGLGARFLLTRATNARQERLEAGLSLLRPRLLAALGPDAPLKAAEEGGRKGKNVQQKHSVK